MSSAPRKSRKPASARKEPTLRVATFNVNGLTSRLPNLIAWLKEAQPHIVCLQELKTQHERFPRLDLARVGYESVWAGQKSWNGVAILSRVGAPIVTRNTLPGDPADDHSRYIEAVIGGLVVASIYLPNGNPQPGPKFDYKLAWFARLRRHAAKLLKSKAPVVLAGDFNVVPTDQDIYPTTSYDDDALLQPETRKEWRALLKQGWTDSIRHLHPDETIYTFWDYLRNRWPRNAGLRIDHLLLSPSLVARLKAAGVDRDVRGQPHPSDHAPVWIDLKWPG
jgi:exodeoxyribonuclease-3